MSLQTHLKDREYAKFCENSDGDTAVRTCTEGELTPSGLKTGFLITTQNVTDTAGALPSGGNLSDRNAIAIRNLDSIETIYIGGPTVTADQTIGTTAGWEVGPNETLQLDITEAITLYGRAESGKTVKVKIFEVA